MYHLEIYAKNGSTLLEKITVESSVIPRIGETMYLGELMSYTPDDLSIFLVRDVSYSIGKNSDQNIYVECVASSRANHQHADALTSKRNILLTELGWLSDQGQS